jgi:hypothetical protein
MSITHHVMSVGEAMSIRVQVILDEEENAMFRQQARKESVSLSRWLRESGRKRLEAERLQGSLRGAAELKAFFKACDEHHQNTQEPDWDEHKSLITEGYSEGRRE